MKSLELNTVMIVSLVPGFPEEICSYKYIPVDWTRTNGAVVAEW